MTEPIGIRSMLNAVLTMPTIRAPIFSPELFRYRSLYLCSYMLEEIMSPQSCQTRYQYPQKFPGSQGKKEKQKWLLQLSQLAKGMLQRIAK